MRRYFLSFADACGNGVRFTYDMGERRTCATTAAGSAQQYEYDAFGNITGIVDGEGHRTKYGLDEWGRITEILRPDGGSEYYHYDYAGNTPETVLDTSDNRPSNPEAEGPDNNNRGHNDNESPKGKTLNEWLADYPELLKECTQWHEEKPEWWGIDPNETDVYYRTPDEVKEIRNKTGESGGHHPHGLALGDPARQTLTPTGETLTVKNPIHSQVTGLQRQVINIIKRDKEK